MDKVFVGTRDMFNVVKTSHSVVGVCSNFGSFVKFVVISVDSEEDLRLPKRPRNDEDVAGYVISVPSLRKDGLYNSMVKFCSEHGIGWREPENYGKRFIQDLSNLLWYIDGHHHVLASRACLIPSLFSKSVGYYRPELSKHRKQSIFNLNRGKLLEYSSVLQEHVMSNWIQQPEWD
jgi:hypothetical protein